MTKSKVSWRVTRIMCECCGAEYGVNGTDGQIKGLRSSVDEPAIVVVVMPKVCEQCHGLRAVQEETDDT